MDNKEAIIQATIKLIEEKGEHLDEVTVREICKRAGVGLGAYGGHQRQLVRWSTAAVR